MREWRATRRVMQSAVITAADLLRAEFYARASSAPDDVWRSRYQSWAAQILKTYGLDVRLSGELPSQRDNRGVLLLCAHRSPLDIAVLVSRMPDLRFLSRADVEHWPIVGTAAKRARTLFVERGNRKSALQAVEQMRAVLAAGDSLAVFPEGTTKSSSTITAFRSGAFRARAGLDVDVWIAALCYPASFGWGRNGQSLLEHLRTVAAQETTRVDVAFERLVDLPMSHTEAARVSREKLQDLDHLLRVRAGV